MNENLLERICSIFKCLFLVVFFFSAFTACGAPKKYSMDSDQLSINNSGIVFGKVTQQRLDGLLTSNLDSGGGRGLVFKNKGTGEIFTYAGAHYFEMRLPEGTYQLVGMGTPNGRIIPKTEPFEFNISNGEVKYLGSIVADRDLKNHLEKFHIVKPILGEHVFSIKEYGDTELEGLLLTPTGRARSPFFTFYIIDEREEIVGRFKEKYPDIHSENIIMNFLK